MPVTNLSEQLYEASKSLLGQQLCKNPVLGCTESISKVINKAFGEHLAYDGTAQIYTEYLIVNSHWLEVTESEAGDIVVYVSGTNTNLRVQHGHILVQGKNISPDGSVYMMSNNSNTGFYDTHLTKKMCVDYFQTFGGFEPHYFRRIS